MSAVVTYEEMREAHTACEEAKQNFSRKYHDFLDTVLEEAGVRNKIVKLKGKGLVGHFQVVEISSLYFRPWEITFYPLKKDGSISKKSKYLPNFLPWKEETLVQQLKDMVEEVMTS